MSLKAKIEAVIYASEEPVTLAQLTGLLGHEGQAELDHLESAQQALALDEAASEDAAPEENAPDQVVSEQAAPDQAAADHVESAEAAADQAAADQDELGQDEHGQDEHNREVLVDALAPETRAQAEHAEAIKRHLHDA